MSSGAYGLALPLAVIGAGASVIADGIDKIKTLNREQQQAQREADAAKCRVDAFVRDVSAELDDVITMLNVAIADKRERKDETQAVSLEGIAVLDRSHVDSGVDEDVLLFSELNVSEGTITYVAIDFSDMLSVYNARNSTDYRKMQISSRFTKRLMLLGVPKEKQGEVESFIRLMDELLDDKTVGLDTFEFMLSERFALLERACVSAAVQADDAMWMRYCALCAVAHRQPQMLRSEELREATGALAEKVLLDRYRRGAAQALMETMKELGLELQGDVVLEQLPGQMFADPGNSDYSIFVNASEQGFVLEMTENERLSPEHRKNKESLCKKRKQIADRMKEKGYDLILFAEADDVDVAHEKVSVSSAAPVGTTAEERIRKRRMINGKKGKSRAIGGS